MGQKNLEDLNDAMRVAYASSPPAGRAEMLSILATSMAKLADHGTPPMTEAAWRSLNGDIGELCSGIATLAIALSYEVNQ